MQLSFQSQQLHVRIYVIALFTTNEAAAINQLVSWAQQEQESRKKADGYI